jgi:hypothetical protein
MQWAQESPIEGWFPLWCGERCGCDVIRDAKEEQTPDPYRPRCVRSSALDSGTCVHTLPV